ncbi:MAG: polynucleotide adenylyltransferase PcnB [Pseudomonadota bacterium]
MQQPQIIPRGEHGLSRKQVSQNALKVLYRLKDCGFEPFLVGGCVRDILLDHMPKDFDVATDATPEEIRSNFRNCRLIGRRFRLAHIHFGRDYIEVATFRGTQNEDGEEDARRHDDDGRLLADNVYGTIEEDAVRRDFTVNALYYDVRDFSVRDYVGGFDDLRAGVLRLIGDPEARYREDPVRMLRAIRFAAKLDFSIAPETAAPIAGLGDLLESIPPARLFDESLKLFMSGNGAASLAKLLEYGLFDQLFPASAPFLRDDSGTRALVDAAMDNTDERVAEEKPVTPAFLFATMLWPAVRAESQSLMEEESLGLAEALSVAADDVIHQQVRRIAIPRRFSVPMREIWQLQPRFEARKGKRALRLLEHPRFRAAYDFLLLRVHEEPELEESARFWTEIQELDASQLQERLFGQGGGGGGGGNTRRRRGGRRRGRRRRAKPTPESDS